MATDALGDKTQGKSRLVEAPSHWRWRPCESSHRRVFYTSAEAESRNRVRVCVCTLNPPPPAVGGVPQQQYRATRLTADGLGGGPGLRAVTMNYEYSSSMVSGGQVGRAGRGGACTRRRVSQSQQSGVKLVLSLPPPSLSHTHAHLQIRCTNDLALRTHAHTHAPFSLLFQGEARLPFVNTHSSISSAAADRQRMTLLCRSRKWFSLSRM